MAKQGFATSDRRKVEVLAGATEIKKHDCGTVFVINNTAAGAVEHTIPAAAALGDGWHCKIVQQSADHAKGSSLGAGTICMVEFGVDDSTDGIALAGQKITFDDVAGAGAAGDEVEIVVANGQFFVQMLMAT